MEGNNNHNMYIEEKRRGGRGKIRPSGKYQEEDETMGMCIQKRSNRNKFKYSPANRG